MSIYLNKCALKKKYLFQSNHWNQSPRQAGLIMIVWNVGTRMTKVPTAAGGQRTRSQYRLWPLGLTQQGADNLWPLGYQCDMTTQEQACCWKLSSLRNNVSISFEQIKWSYLLSPSRPPPHQVWSTVSKNVKCLVRGRGTRAEIRERKMERKVQLMVAVLIVGVRRCLGNKSSTVAGLSLSQSKTNTDWAFKWETDSQKTKQHLLSSWKSALSTPVSCTSSREVTGPQTLRARFVTRWYLNRVVSCRLWRWVITRVLQ